MNEMRYTAHAVFTPDCRKIRYIFDTEKRMVLHSRRMDKLSDNMFLALVTAWNNDHVIAAEYSQWLPVSIFADAWGVTVAAIETAGEVTR